MFMALNSVAAQWQDNLRKRSANERVEKRGGMF